uniref:Transcription factor bHLH5 n=1 Tax=Nothapodytes nimmoniana TaxID=159386 RepID=A0A9E8Z815_NOTNI|nr:transcription factor bHLH5 [Nothapodytes nimmoniana]
MNAISQYALNNFLPLAENGGVVSPLGFDGYGTPPLLMNKGKGIKPLETPVVVGTVPSLFQSGATALTSSNSQEDMVNFGNSGEEVSRVEVDRDKGKRPMEEDDHVVLLERQSNGEGRMDEVDLSGLNSDSDDQNGKYASTSLVSGDTNWNSNVEGSGCGDQKGKKKGLPAKNLMAERRRRKKLNDRLYMLRSVVPKISKMDRASILADAIEYLKELLQKNKDLNDELQSITPVSSLPYTTTLQPWESTTPPLPGNVKQELCRNTLPSPNNPPSIQVEVREGGAFNIHMFCTRRPGLLLSTMGALDNLGLDIQQAVISCFNGFALDVFKAEKYDGVLELDSDQIKAALFETVAFHGLL